MKSPFLYIFALLAVVLCGCYDKLHDAPVCEAIESDNSDLSELQLLCQNGCYNIVKDMVCACRITSSDSEGNFYRTIVVEDESGAAEIRLGIYNSASQYPVGLMIALNLKGCAAMYDNGVIQIGLPPQEHDALPREMEAQEIIDRHIIRSNSVDAIEPTVYDITSLESSLCGRFVAIKDIRHAPLTEEDEAHLMVGYHRFVDDNGDAIFSYASTYADFANNEVPTAKIEIRGILYYETVGMNIGRQFVIKPRFADDISISDNAY